LLTEYHYFSCLHSIAGADNTEHAHYHHTQRVKGMQPYFTHNYVLFTQRVWLILCKCSFCFASWCLWCIHYWWI